MWVTFAKDFDFSPASLRGRVTIAYKAGMRAKVTRECVDAACAADALTRDDRHEDPQPGKVQAEAQSPS